jgi:hypothetical protein
MLQRYSVIVMVSVPIGLILAVFACNFTTEQSPFYARLSVIQRGKIVLPIVKSIVIGYSRPLSRPRSNKFYHYNNSVSKIFFHFFFKTYQHHEHQELYQEMIVSYVPALIKDIFFVASQGYTR